MPSHTSGHAYRSRPGQPLSHRRLDDPPSLGGESRGGDRGLYVGHRQEILVVVAVVYRRSGFPDVVEGLVVLSTGKVDGPPDREDRGGEHTFGVALSASVANLIDSSHLPVLTNESTRLPVRKTPKVRASPTRVASSMPSVAVSMASARRPRNSSTSVRLA